MTRFKNELLVLLVITAILTSCNDNCNCSEEWDVNIQYLKDDMVSYEGTCWVAIAGGWGVEPGPYLEDGNDIWFECEE